MFEPLVSIIVPIYNAEKYLHQCIESLIKQEYKNLEIILVNDGSQDSSLAICKSFEKIDSRILVLNQKNQGVSRARAAGIEAAEGEYIGFVDSDDFIDPKIYLVLLTKILTEGSQCATLIDFTIRSPSKSVIKSKSPVDNIGAIGELFLLRFPTSMWAYLYKTDLVKGVKMSDNIHFFEDFEFNFNYLKACDKVSICKGSYYNYRANVESINHQDLNSKKLSCLKIYDKIKKDSFVFYNEDLNGRSLFFRANFVISMIVSFSGSSIVDKRDLSVLKRNNCMVFFESFFSKYVSVKYKLVMFGFLISPAVTVRLIRYRGL